MNLNTFQIYGISIKHPEDWKVYLNPNNGFSKERGVVKIDKAISSGDPLSISLRWQQCVRDVNINDYSQQISCEMNKRFKNKFKLFESNLTVINGHKGVLLNFSYRASHQIFAFLGKEKVVQQMQAAVYCDISRRMVIANIASTPENILNNQRVLHHIIKSLTCHEDTDR